MAYLDDLLAGGERIKLRAHRHLLFLVLRLIPFVAATIALWVLAYAAQRWLPRVGDWAMIVLLVLSLVPLAVVIYRFLSWKHEEFAVTNYRIVQVDGILNKRTFDSSLEKVNDVVMRQSIFGRMFGFGDIEIITGSEIGVNSILGITDPFAFKRALMEAKVDAGRAPWAEREFIAAPERPPDVREGRAAHLLDSLQELRDSGVITEEEYQERLRRVLDR